ncbi:MAG: hypothetical protein WCP55_00280 [Lentisphaerota bacterium]
MESVILPSGAELKITLLPLEDAWEIQRIVATEISALDVDIRSVDFTKLQPQDILNLKKPFFQALSSSKLVDASKRCFSRCLYNGLKIDADTFESPKARGDYIFVIFNLLRANISPFFANLLSFLKKD